MPTPVYLAMATKGGLFLEITARDAFAKTGNPRIKTFARAEVTEQVTLADKIDRVTGGTVAVPVGGGQPGACPSRVARRRPGGGAARGRGRGGRRGGRHRRRVLGIPGVHPPAA